MPSQVVPLHEDFPRPLGLSAPVVEADQAPVDGPGDAGHVAAVGQGVEARAYPEAWPRSVAAVSVLGCQVRVGDQVPPVQIEACT
jgi:hypothetical protein